MGVSVPRPGLGAGTIEGEITIPNVSRQISVAVVPNLVFLQQPIISKKCDGLLQLERLMKALGRPSGAVPSMTPSMASNIIPNPKFEC